MYTFTDGGGRSLTLRPEGTAPVCRAYVQHGMHKLPQPVKLWYLSSFFRYERAQKGRYRQFWQVGAEALGSEDPAVDAESIVLLGALLREMGVAGVRLRLSSLGGAASRERYRERLQAHLRANEERLASEVRERIELNPLRAFDSAHEGTVATMREAPKLLDELDASDAEHFAQVRALLDRAGVAYEVDPTLVRGLDYYTRTVFEFTSDALGAQSGVGGGGRYDGLVAQLGGPPTPGHGLGRGRGAGAPRRAVPRSAGGRAVDLYVGFDVVGEDGSYPRVEQAAWEILCETRSAGLSAQMEMAGRSLKGQLGHANRIGARYVAIVGERETVLKDMREGAQETLATEQTVHAVLRGCATCVSSRPMSVDCCEDSRAGDLPK